MFKVAWRRRWWTLLLHLPELSISTTKFIKAVMSMIIKESLIKIPQRRPYSSSVVMLSSLWFKQETHLGSVKPLLRFKPSASFHQWEVCLVIWLPRPMMMRWISWECSLMPRKSWRLELLLVGYIWWSLFSQWSKCSNGMSIDQCGLSFFSAKRCITIRIHYLDETARYPRLKLE